MNRILVAAGCALWALLLAGWARDPVAPSGGWAASGAPGTIIGPSAMMQWQRRGEVVLDARSRGRFVAHAVRAEASPVPADGPVLVIADSREAAMRVSPRALWVPARLLEIPLRRDVRQISPRLAFERARRGEVEVIDVSEAREWSWERLPFGRRVDWSRVISRDRSWIRGRKPIVFACRLGGRSQIAARALASEGFETFSLSGGVWGWQEQGLPIASGAVARGGADG